MKNTDDDFDEEQTWSAEESERRHRELEVTEHLGDSAELETRPQIETSPAAPARRVLVVEDNPLSQQVLARQLATLGFVYDIVADGGEAFISVTRGRYDVVLMDLQMPVLDGPSVTRLIRQWEKEHGTPPVKIVAVTVSASAADRLRCLAIGMDDHLPKPLRIADLSSVLKRLLDSSSLAAFAPERSEPGSHSELDHSMIEGLRATRRRRRHIPSRPDHTVSRRRRRPTHAPRASGRGWRHIRDSNSRPRSWRKQRKHRCCWRDRGLPCDRSPQPASRRQSLSKRRTPCSLRVRPRASAPRRPVLNCEDFDGSSTPTLDGSAAA